MALSKSKAATNAAHMKKLDAMLIKPYKNQGAAIRAAAEESDQSLQKYILDAVRARMEQEGHEWPEPDKGGEEGGL